MELVPGVHQFQVPIPGGAMLVDGNLEYTLTYAIKERDGWVMVDAGWESEPGWISLTQQLAEDGVAFSDVRSLVVTHIHADHLGLAPRFKQRSPKTELVMHEYDVPSRSPQGGTPADDHHREEWFRRNGVPQDVLDAVISWRGRGDRNFFADVRVDRVITERYLRLPGTEDIYTLWTPGHTSGHLCIYDANRELLFSGDHVLPKISPHISFGVDAKGNPLKNFLDSLAWVGTFDVRLVCPPHQHVFPDLKHRVQELTEHHQRRLDEILRALEAGPLTAYDIASRVKWNVKRPWPQMDPGTRVMAMFETGAHLRLLVEAGKVSEVQGEPTMYQVPIPTSPPTEG